MLPDEAFSCLARRLHENAHVLELGSGEGTRRLVERYLVTSIEHDPVYLGRYGARYIHAPLVNGWYDPEVIRTELDGRAFDAVIIDGPPGPLRLGAIAHLGLLPEVPTLIDDTHRMLDRRLATTIAKRRGARLRTYRCQGNRAFSTVGW